MEFFYTINRVLPSPARSRWKAKHSLTKIILFFSTPLQPSFFCYLFLPGGITTFFSFALSFSFFLWKRVCWFPIAFTERLLTFLCWTRSVPIVKNANRSLKGSYTSGGWVFHNSMAMCLYVFGMLLYFAFFSPSLYTLFPFLQPPLCQRKILL